MEYIGDYYARLDERRRIAAGKSQLLVYCLDLVEAALWSIAGGEDPQAIVQLDGCIEILFKAELETVHRVLVADTRRLDYEGLKRLLRDAFRSHPRGQKLQIDDYDIEQTITFAEAKRRVRDLVPAVRLRDADIQVLHAARNEIVHYGPDRTRSGDYSRMIATIAFPFVSELLAEVGPVDFGRLVTPPVLRELTVARDVCEMASSKDVDVGPYCLRTVRWRVLHDRVQWPHPDDNSDSVQLDDRDYAVADRVRAQFERRWDLTLDHHCKICEWYPAFVAVDVETQPVRRLVPKAFECPKCALTIDAADRYLAALHIDDISTDQTETLLKDIGL